MSDGHAQIDPEALLAHGDFVRAIARSLLWDEHAAEDVVQQTWLAALGACGSASATASPATSRGWLGAVARNLAIKRLRSDRRRSARESASSRPEAVPSDVQILERERLRRSVVAEVLALPEPYRATVLLRYFEALPPRDVARRTGVPVETVRTRTRRAIEMLRVRLDGRHSDERDVFCGALAMWAGLPRGGATPNTPTAAIPGGLGGLLVASKTAVIGAVAVVAALTAWILWPGDGAPVQLANDAPAPPADPGAPKEQPPRARAVTETEPAAPTQSQPPKEPFVRGRVVDAQGRPVSGAEIWIIATEVVPPDASGKRPTGNVVRIATDGEGRFEKTLATAATCRVQPSPVGDPAFEAKRGDARDVVPPAEGLEFIVERRPTATLVVTVLDPARGKLVTQYACSFGQRVVRQQPTTADGRTEVLVRLEAAAGDTVNVVATAGGASAERGVSLREGDRVEVRIDLQRDGEVCGRVVDAAGLPVVNALAFFGEEDVARGDEPFKPFDEKRVREGERTDGDGQFELKGMGRWVTIWHADGGPVTVARADAGSVVLPARGVVRGVLRGADGAPRATTKVFLDRVRETTTDGEGRFEFKAVEPGTRGLSLTGGKPKAYVAVRVTAGAAVDVDMRPGIPNVRIEWPGRTDLGRLVGLVPVSEVGSLGIGQPSDGGITVADVLPGRYILVGEGGAVALADVSGPSATANVGTGVIVVKAKPKTRLWIVPEGAGYLARLLAGRMAGAGVPADGVQRFTGLAPGRYEIGVERDGLRATIDVRDAAVEVTVE